MAKGISPLIASVLLVSLTLTLVYLVANWAASFTSGSAGIMQEKSDTSIKCSSAGLSIDNVSYNCTSGKLSLEAYNSGTKDLSDFRMQVLLKNGSSYALDTEPNATIYASDTQVFYNSSLNVSFSLIDRVLLRSSVCPLTARSELESAKIMAYGC